MVKLVSSKKDLQNTEALLELLTKAGYNSEAKKLEEESKKISFLRRLGSGLTSFETGNALYQTKYESQNFLKTYAGDVLTGLREAVTGKQVREEPKKTYADIAEKEGMQQREGKIDWADILGFGGDVLLDPFTYLGGFMTKGAVKTTGKVAKIGLKGIEKVAPKSAVGLNLIGEGVKEAMGKAFVFGYKTSAGLAEDTIETVAKLKGVRAGIAKANAKIYSTFTTAQKTDLVDGLLKAKGSERLSRGIAKEVGEKLGVKEPIKATKFIEPVFTDPKVKELYESVLKPRRLKFSEIADITEPFENYFPGINKQTLKGVNKAVSTMKVGTEGYKKQFKNLLKGEDILKDPAEAFARNEYEIVRNVLIRRDLSRYIKTYGKPLKEFTSDIEAKKLGYTLVKEKGIGGKELGYLKDIDKKFIDNLISPEFNTVDQLARATGFDYLTGLFKRYVTGIFAPFHVRNYISGNIQNFEKLGAEVFKPDNIADGLKATTKIVRGKSLTGTTNIAGKVKSVKSVWAPFKKRFKDASQYIADWDQYITDDSVKIIDSNLKKLNPLDAENFMFKGARVVGNFIETQQKAIAYVTSLRQGKSINDALKLAEKAGFDYRMITPFESKVMKRIIPFYAFTRKNLELQATTLLNQPQRISYFTKLFKETFQPKTEDDVKPEWMSEYFMQNIGVTEKGEKQVIAGFGTPIEEFAYKFSGNPVLKFLSQTNPLIKYPLEKATGKDFFRNQDLKDVYSASEYSKAPDIVKNILQVHKIEKPVYIDGKKTNETKNVYVADPERLHIARNLFTARIVNYLETLFEEEDLTGAARVVKLTTGVKPYTIDEETVKYFEDKDKREKLMSILKRLDIIKEFSIPYLPK